jgi:hypothetical protein
MVFGQVMIGTQEEASALQMNGITLTFEVACVYELNTVFHIRCHRLRFFDVLCGYFCPRIGHIENWTK